MINLDEAADGVLRVGGAEGTQLMHDAFEGLLLFGGIP
jgi:hypothetical protein